LFGLLGDSLYSFQKFGLQSHQIVRNFNIGRHIHFAEDVDVNPIACAEQFVDPDPLKAQTSEDMLKRARLILSTELGKDPLLRQHVRTLFREEARITVEPTERGSYKIEESHPYFASIFFCLLI
jgi:transcription elongation factor SPT6